MTCFKISIYLWKKDPNGHFFFSKHLKGIILLYPGISRVRCIKFILWKEFIILVWMIFLFFSQWNISISRIWVINYFTFLRNSSNKKSNLMLMRFEMGASLCCPGCSWTIKLMWLHCLTFLINKYYNYTPWLCSK